MSGSFLTTPPGLPPRGVVEALGYVHPGDVDIVLDGAGFAYGDSWGAEKTLQSVRYYRWMKSQGARIVLMPQSLGPFDDPAVRDAAQQLFDVADLVFPRDDTAAEFAHALCDASKLQQCPDFTCLVKPADVSDLGLPENAAAIIPNRKMIQRTDASSDEYETFVARIAELFVDHGLAPFVLPHATYDAELAVRIREKSGGNLPLIEESDALRLKGIIGSCRAVMCSRFHGLCSALSQGVPAVATGWSHKYEHLLAEYECLGALVAPSDSEEKLVARVAGVIGSANIEKNAARLRTRAQWNKERSTEMWQRIDAFVGV
ncbi:MAG: colanic acid/amylovoran biosynthesis protein [Bradymonadia bacterium]|jgi:colanic acid/amylovoran biosynthesis protein